MISKQIYLKLCVPLAVVAGIAGRAVGANVVAGAVALQLASGAEFERSGRHRARARLAVVRRSLRGVSVEAGQAELALDAGRVVLARLKQINSR